MPNKKSPPRRAVLSEQLCACGCGLRTFISVATKRERGAVKGKPSRFRTGHQHRVYQEGKYYFHDRSYQPNGRRVS